VRKLTSSRPRSARTAWWHSPSATLTGRRACNMKQGPARPCRVQGDAGRAFRDRIS
jgi:hypothetical protein